MGTLVTGPSHAEAVQVTLVLVVTDEHSVHMSTDFRLTDAHSGALVSDDAYKFVTVQQIRFSAIVGVTGLGQLEDMPIGRWIAEWAADLTSSDTLESAVESLQVRAGPALASVSDRNHARHTFVVGGMAGTQSAVFFVSNFERLVDGRLLRAPAASVELSVTGVRPKQAIALITGDRDAVSGTDLATLELVVRAGSGDDRIQQTLADINHAASKVSQLIGPGCFTQSLHADGTGSAAPHLLGEHGDDGFQPPDIELLFERLGIRINPAKDASGNPVPVRMGRQTFSRGGGTSDKDFLEQLKLRPNSAEIHNNYGAFLNSQGRREQAVEELELATTLDPDYVTAHGNLASTLWQLGDVDGAKQAYARVLELVRPGTYLDLVSDAAQFHDFALRDQTIASELHQAATADGTNHLAAIRYVGFKVRHAEEREVAAGQIEAIVGSAPPDHRILMEAAHILAELGELREALQLAKRAVEAGRRDAGALATCGELALELGDADLAVYYLQRAIKRHDAVGLEWLYGRALLETGKLDGAVRYLTRAAASAPEIAALQSDLACALLLRGRTQQGRAAAHRARDGDLGPEEDLELLCVEMIARRDPHVPSEMQVLLGASDASSLRVVRALARRNGPHRPAAQIIASYLPPNAAAG